MDSFVLLYDIRLIIKLESHCVLDHIKYVINPFNVGRGWSELNIHLYTKRSLYALFFNTSTAN